MEQYQSQDITKLAKALLLVQKSLQPALKDSVNPYAKSTYASLNSVMEVCKDSLISNGIWLCQYPVALESHKVGGAVAFASKREQEGYVVQDTHTPFLVGLVTKLTHAESGQWQSSLAVIPLPKADPQGMGSAITYARRYALSAMLGIVTEEDLDGEVNRKPPQGRQSPKNGFGNASNANTRTSNQKPKENIENQSRKSTKEYAENQSNVFQNNRRELSSFGTDESNSHQLPTLNGVVYDSLQVQDENGNFREIITATGNTVPNKNYLMQVGFRWNPNKKVWWKYADAV